MTALTFDQAQALAGLMRERDAQTAAVKEMPSRMVFVSLFDEADQGIAMGQLTSDGRIREMAIA